MVASGAIPLTSWGRDIALYLTDFAIITNSVRRGYSFRDEQFLVEWLLDRVADVLESARPWIFISGKVLPQIRDSRLGRRCGTRSCRIPCRRDL